MSETAWQGHPALGWGRGPSDAWRAPAAELLKARPAATPGLLRQALERIAEQAERLGRVINNAHDFVRCGEQPHESLAVRCDRAMLDQVLANLARNDIHAMQTTHGRYSNTAARWSSGPGRSAWTRRSASRWPCPARPKAAKLRFQHWPSHPDCLIA